MLVGWVYLSCQFWSVAVLERRFQTAEACRAALALDGTDLEGRTKGHARKIEAQRDAARVLSQTWSEGRVRCLWYILAAVGAARPAPIHKLGALLVLATTAWLCSVRARRGALSPASVSACSRWSFRRRPRLRGQDARGHRQPKEGLPHQGPSPTLGTHTHTHTPRREGKKSTVRKCGQSGFTV